MTPLIAAASKGHKQMVETLLRRGALVDQGYFGGTALTKAALYGKTAIVRILLQHGANVEVRNNDGKTPLHGAVTKGYVNVVKLLLEHGADANARDSKRKLTPLAWLFFEYFPWTGSGWIPFIPTEKKHTIMKLLISYGAKIDDAIEEKILARFPLHAPRIEAALLFEIQRRTCLKHTAMPVDLINLIFSFQECYENQRCCDCRTKLRELPTPELMPVRKFWPLHRICADCDQKRQERNDHTCPACKQSRT